jgi:hypothetical protein
MIFSHTDQVAPHLANAAAQKTIVNHIIGMRWRIAFSESQSRIEAENPTVNAEERLFCLPASLPQG